MSSVSLQTQMVKEAIEEILKLSYIFIEIHCKTPKNENSLLLNKYFVKSTVTTRKKVGFTKFLLKCKKFPNHATISQGRFGETSVKSTYFAELRS